MQNSNHTALEATLTKQKQEFDSILIEALKQRGAFVRIAIELHKVSVEHCKTGQELINIGGNVLNVFKVANEMHQNLVNLQVIIQCDAPKIAMNETKEQ